MRGRTYLEGAAAGDGLVLVERGREQALAVAEKLGHARLEGGRTGRSANELDKLNAVLAHVRVVQSQAQRDVDALHQVLDHCLEVLAVNVRGAAQSPVSRAGTTKKNPGRGDSGHRHTATAATGRRCRR